MIFFSFRGHWKLLKHAHCTELSHKLLHRKCYGEMTDLIKYLKTAHANKKKKHIMFLLNCTWYLQLLWWFEGAAVYVTHKECVCCVCLCMCTHPRTGKGSIWEMTTAYLHYYTRVKADEIPPAAGETTPQHTVNSTFTANKCQEQKNSISELANLFLFVPDVHSKRPSGAFRLNQPYFYTETEGINKTSWWSS